MKRTRPLVVTIVVVLSVLATGAAGAGASQSMVTVTVSVVDQGGNPISNAELRAAWDGGSTSASTKSNGKAFIDVPEGRNVTIEIDHPVYVRNHPYELVDASEGSVTVDAARKGSATVTVTGPGGPIDDARVLFRRDGRVAASGTTDPDGTFDTGTIMSGTYAISVLQPGYYRTSRTVTVSGKSGFDLEIEPGTVTVAFEVLDQNFNPAQPVAGATIEGEVIGSVKTQSNGIQRVSVPVNSEIEVSVKKDGYRTVTRSIAVEESPREVTIATRKNLEISFSLLNDRVVVGEKVRVAVTDQYGNPVRESAVYLDGRQVGTTDDDGVVLVTIDSEGEHAIHAEAESLSTDEHTVVGVRPAPAESTPAPDAESTPAADARANADASLSGVVAVPGMAGEQFHLKSLGIGLGAGAAVALVAVLYLRLRFR